MNKGRNFRIIKHVKVQTILPLLTGRFVRGLLGSTHLTLMLLTITLAFICCGPEKRGDSYSDSSQSSSSTNPSDKCSVNCGFPADLSLSFSGTTILNDPACTYKSVEIFDAAKHLLVFVIQQCGLNPQLITFRSSYDLKTLSKPETLSTECEAMNGSVESADFAAGDGGFIVTEVCKTIFDTYTVYVSKLSDTGDRVNKVILDGRRERVDRPEGFDYGIAWNSSTTEWGIVGNNYFRRLDKNLNALGGAELLTCGYYGEKCKFASSNADSSVTVKNGDWIVVHELLHIYNSSGIRRCFFSNKGYGGGFVFGPRHFNASFNWGGASYMRNKIVDFISCSVEDIGSFGGVVPRHVKDYSNYGHGLYNAWYAKQPFVLNGKYMAFPILYNDGEMKLSILNNATVPEWVVHLGVADNVEVTRSRNVFAVGNGNIFASYIQNNSVVIASTARE